MDGQVIVAPESRTLVQCLRQVPTLYPSDSVSRALDVFRYSGSDTLPVVDGNHHLRGVVSLRDLRPLLKDGDSDRAIVAPVSEWMRAPGATGRPEMDLEEVRSAMLASGEAALVIIDSSDRYLGAVSLHELLSPLPVKPRPQRIGGMATPWGVYLTNGSLQAGVGTFALMGSGALLGLLLAASHYGVGLLAWIGTKLTGAPLYTIWNSPEPSHVTSQAIAWMALNALSLPLFLLLLRSLPLAQFHAAEHQAVHAMERGEPLRPEIVRRMPRVHPRCGTNIMAGGLIFAVVFQGIAALPVRWVDASDAAVLGALTALFTWRSVGAFLQQHFTTREAADRHIASGIAAAEDLETKFLHSTPGYAGLTRRIWCMGMVQTMVGILVASTVSLYVFDALFQALR